MGIVQLRTIKTKTTFGANIDVMRWTRYVGNIRVHQGHIVCNPVVDHHIRKEVILYEYSLESNRRLDFREYAAHIEICKQRINEFIRQSTRKETDDYEDK